MQRATQGQQLPFCFHSLSIKYTIYNFYFLINDENNLFCSLAKTNQMSSSSMNQKRNIVITGGNIGIGLQTAKGLYSDGHNVIFGSRNQQRNVAAAKQIAQSAPNSKGTVKYYSLDLSKRVSIEEFANNVCKQFNKIDVLVNNAGMMMNEWEVNQWEVQMTMAVNHFGHFLLTYLLFDRIKKSNQGRVISLSSQLHARTSLATSQDLDSKQSFSSMGNYSKSKLANVQFTVILAERLKNYPKIKAVCLHPGIVDSDFATKLKCCNIVSCLKMVCCCFFVSVETGARTSLFLSRQPFAKLQSGEYYDSDTSIGQMNSLGRNREHGQKLWEVSQKLFNIKFSI